MVAGACFATRRLSSRLVVASVKTGKALLGRELVPPAGFTFRGRECSISPDGGTLAAPAQGNPSDAPAVVPWAWTVGKLKLWEEERSSRAMQLSSW